jgi:uncharacterized membrane protein
MTDQNTNSEQQDNIIDVDEQKIMSALSYVGFLVLVPLFVSRDDKYVVWHAKQGLVLLVGLILAAIAAQWIAVIGNVLFLVLLLIDVVALVQALLGTWWKIPVIGNIAEKFKI